MIYSSNDKVIVAGDWHGDNGGVDAAVDHALTHGCNIVLHLGDYGYGWPGTGGRFEEYTNTQLEKHDLLMVGIKGNHENHDYLESLPESDVPDLLQVRSNMYYAPNGVSFTIGSSVSTTSFGAFGGGYSIDQKHRTPYISYWPQEEPTEADIMRLQENTPVDVLLTHDAPLCAWPSHMRYTLSELVERESKRCAHITEVAANLSGAKLILHGHHHQKNRKLLTDGTPVIGLADSSSSGNIGLLDLSTLDFEYVY